MKILKSIFYFLFPSKKPKSKQLNFEFEVTDQDEFKQVK